MSQTKTILQQCNLQLGDLVVTKTGDERNLIRKVIKATEPIEVVYQKVIQVPVIEYKQEYHQGVGWKSIPCKTDKLRDETVHGYFCAKTGKKVISAANVGYITLAPVFDVSLSSVKIDIKKYKNSNISVTNFHSCYEKLDVVVLGTKLLELQHILREIATGTKEE